VARNVPPQPADSDSLEYQLTVVESVLKSLKLTGSWPSIKETIRYFWLSNNVLSTGQEEGPFYQGYTLNPQLQLGEFELNPLEILSLLENGLQDFGQIKGLVSTGRTYLAVYEADSVIQHHECTPAEYRLLEAARSRNQAALSDILEQPGTGQLLAQLEAYGLVSSG